MKKVIAVYRSKYLPISETFIYEQIIKLKKYKPIVITSKSINNRSVFPYSNIFRAQNKKEIPRIIRKRNAKLIHARFGSGGVAMLPIKEATRLPLLTSFHGSDLTKQLRKNKSYRIKLPKLFLVGNKFTVVSKHMKKKLTKLGCPRSKIEILKSGIDLSKFKFESLPSYSGGKIRVLSVGRLIEKKGAKYLLQAFSRIYKQYPNAKLIIVGDGEEEKSLKKLAEDLSIENAVVWKGALSHNEVRKEMEKCHIFSLPSITSKDGNQEGIPNVLMEAMAIGRPVVASKHAGIPELVIHEKTGFIVSERDEKALAEMIIYVLEKMDQWKDLLTRARKHVENEHNIVKQIKKLENIYNKMLKKKEKKKGVSPKNKFYTRFKNNYYKRLYKRKYIKTR